MKSSGLGRWSRLGIALAVIGMLALAVAIAPQGAARGLGFTNLGPVEVEVRSEYSRIRIRRNRNIRTMIFVRDSGEEALETQMDLSRPHELRFTYLKHMFLSYVLRPERQEPDKVLIVGLGGGSMIHFLQRYDPEVHIDAVEIDPVVVRLAQQYFGVRTSDKVNIFTADAFEYLRKADSKYGVIYMDAFLKPSEDTDSTGVPLNLRTRRFYQDIQNNLQPDGLVVFNLNPHRQVYDDVKTIRDSFPQTYVFALPSRGGLVVVASLSPQRESARDLLRKAQLVDRQFNTSFSFQDMVRRLQQP